MLTKHLLLGDLPTDPSRMTSSSSHPDLLGSWDTWTEAAVPGPAPTATKEGRTLSRAQDLGRHPFQFVWLPRMAVPGPHLKPCQSTYCHGFPAPIPAVRRPCNPRVAFEGHGLGPFLDSLACSPVWGCSAAVRAASAVWRAEMAEEPAGLVGSWRWPL